MPQSYSSFNPQGPNVDVNLFSNAASAGINQGNAQKTTWQAVAEGVTDAIQTGTSVASGLAALEAQQIQNEFNSDPEVRAAKEQAAVAEGTLKESAALEAQLQAQIIRDNEEIYKSQKLEDLKARAAESSQKRQDIENMSAVSTALSDPLPANKEAIFRNNNVLGTLLRYPDFGARSIAALEAQGVSPDLVKPWKQSISAVEMEKRQMALFKEQEEARIRAEASTKKEFSESLQTFSTDPALNALLSKRVGKDAFDPNKLHIVKADEIEWDNTTQQPIFDVRGAPLPASADNPFHAKDKRVLAFYDGKQISAYTGANGERFIKALPALASNYNTYFPKEESTDAPQQETQQGSSAPTPTGGPSPDALQKMVNPEVGTAGFEARSQKLAGIPRAERGVVVRINSNPLLMNQTPLYKSLIAAESQGKADAKSETGVKGISQVTKETFDDMQRRFPDLLKPEDYNTPEGQIVAGKIYFGIQLSRFKDFKLAVAAYNAGPEYVAEAIDQSSVKTWEGIQPALKTVLDKVPKFKAIQKYERETSVIPGRVEKYFRYFSNGR